MPIRISPPSAGDNGKPSVLLECNWPAASIADIIDTDFDFRDSEGKWGELNIQYMSVRNFVYFAKDCYGAGVSIGSFRKRTLAQSSFSTSKKYLSVRYGRIPGGQSDPTDGLLLALNCPSVLELASR